MPTYVVVVHDEPEFVGQLVSALSSAGHDVTPFPDPVAAWDVLSTPQRIEVLVTGVTFPPNRSNGLALALKARSIRPAIHVLFTRPVGIITSNRRGWGVHGPPGQRTCCGRGRHTLAE